MTNIPPCHRFRSYVQKPPRLRSNYYNGNFLLIHATVIEKIHWTFYIQKQIEDLLRILDTTEHVLYSGVWLREKAQQFTVVDRVPD